MLGNGRIVSCAALAVFLIPAAFAGNRDYTGGFVSISPYLSPRIERKITVSGSNVSLSQTGSAGTTAIFKGGYKFKQWRLYGSYKQAKAGVVTVSNTLINAEYVADGGFTVGGSLGQGRYEEDASPGVRAVNGDDIAFGLSIGYAQLKEGFQWGVFFTASVFKIKQTVSVANSGGVAVVSTEVENTLSGVEFELGYGF